MSCLVRRPDFRGANASFGAATTDALVSIPRCPDFRGANASFGAVTTALFIEVSLFQSVLIEGFHRSYGNHCLRLHFCPSDSRLDTTLLHVL